MKFGFQLVISFDDHLFARGKSFEDFDIAVVRDTDFNHTADKMIRFVNVPDKQDFQLTVIQNRLFRHDNGTFFLIKGNLNIGKHARFQLEIPVCDPI